MRILEWLGAGAGGCELALSVVVSVAVALSPAGVFVGVTGSCAWDDSPTSIHAIEPRC